MVKLLAYFLINNGTSGFSHDRMVNSPIYSTAHIRSQFKKDAGVWNPKTTRKPLIGLCQLYFNWNDYKKIQDKAKKVSVYQD